LIAASPLPKKDFRYALPLFRFLQSVELVEEIRVYHSAEVLARFSKTLEEAINAVGDLQASCRRLIHILIDFQVDSLNKDKLVHCYIFKICHRLSSRYQVIKDSRYCAE
jgi:hypothetical protein